MIFHHEHLLVYMNLRAWLIYAKVDHLRAIGSSFCTANSLARSASASNSRLRLLPSKWGTADAFDVVHSGKSYCTAFSISWYFEIFISTSTFWHWIIFLENYVDSDIDLDTDFVRFKWGWTCTYSKIMWQTGETLKLNFLLTSKSYKLVLNKR